MKWFDNPKTVEELKMQYKKLAMQHHPDIGGNNADMQSINSEYDRLFDILKNTHETVDGKTYTATTETSEVASEFRDIISKLINLEGINIEICGSWLWITGNTFPHKAILKELNFKWSKSKTAWYYHTDEYKKSNNKTYTLDKIRGLYGSESIVAEKNLRLTVVQ